MFSAIEIQQHRATADSKLSLQTYSQYLKKRYSLADYCGCNKINILLLLRFAISKWDVRPGAVNPYSATQLEGMVRVINRL